jgi:murein DD-endopeptidase MepM/ murein hydrolase activator NlpD
MNRVIRSSVCAALALMAAGCIPEHYLDRSGAPGASGAATAAARSVTVQQGDTVIAIARRTGVSQQALIEANQLQPPYTLRLGRTLTIPGAPQDVASARPNADDSSGPAPVSVPATVDRVDAAPLAAPGAGAAAPAASAAPPPSGAPAPSTGFRPTTTPSAGAAPPIPVMPVGTNSTPGTAPQQIAGAPRAAGAAGRFSWPVSGRVIAEFGPRPGGAHNDGINIEAPRGTPILAADAGEVIYVGNELRGFGNLVLIRHSDGWVTAYAHADEVMVQRGAQVRRGDTIGRVGTSGNIRAPQLHFEVRRGTRPVNPRQQMEAEPS